MAQLSNGPMAQLSYGPIVQEPNSSMIQWSNDFADGSYSDDLSHFKYHVGSYIHIASLSCLVDVDPTTLGSDHSNQPII